MKTIKEYLSEYPDSTLREYRNYLKEEEDKKEQEEKDSKKKREELLKSYTGKCFRLDFNSESSIFFKLDKEIDLDYSCVRIDAYSVFTYDYDNMKFNLGFEKNRVLNIKYFPYQEEWVKDNTYYPSAYVISEESFKEIVNYYKVATEITKILKEITK